MQQTHFDAFARVTDPATSHAAAQTVNVTYLEGKVLDAIRALPEGATQDDLAAYLDLPTNSITPRFKPLLRKGIVYDTGNVRKGHYGKAQRVLRVTPNLLYEAKPSRSAIVRQVEAEQARTRQEEAVKQARQQAYKTLLGTLQTAHTALAQAEALGKEFMFEFTVDVAGKTHAYVPAMGWFGPEED